MYVEQELGRIAYSLSYQSLQFMPEFEVRVRVLKRLRYLGNEDQLKLKGLFSCGVEISKFQPDRYEIILWYNMAVDTNRKIRTNSNTLC